MEQGPNPIAEMISELVPTIFDMLSPEPEPPENLDDLDEETRQTILEHHRNAVESRGKFRAMASMAGAFFAGSASQPRESDIQMRLYRHMVQSQLESMDMLRGALGVMGAVVREAPRGASGGSGEAPPGYVQIREETYAQHLDAMEKVKEEDERLFAALQKASFMLGYGGDVDEGFLRYLSKRPGPGAKPLAYDLPDGGKTNVLSDAYSAWRSAFLRMREEVDKQAEELNKAKLLDEQ